MAKDWTKEVIDTIKNYTDDVAEAIEQESELQAIYGAGQLQNVNFPPASSTGSANPSERRMWKRYAKDWNVTKRKNASQYGYVSNIIHNKKHYQLTHLLEYGHITRNGKTTRAFKHIDPIGEERSKAFEENIKEIIKRGGKK